MFDFQQILIICQLTSESILILVSQGRIWDAEILFRTLLEGTLKTLYLSIGNDEDKKQKSNEFWIEIPIFNDIKRSDKAKILLENINMLNDDKFKLLRDVIIDANKLDDLRNTYPRKYRRKIENKWSFNNILKELSESNLNYSERLLGLTYQYFIASNLSHMDATAINMIKERNTRNPTRRELVQNAHALRLMNDVLLQALLRLDCFQLYTNQRIDKKNMENDMHKEIIQNYNFTQKNFEENEKKYERLN